MVAKRYVSLGASISGKGAQSSDAEAQAIYSYLNHGFSAEEIAESLRQRQGTSYERALSRVMECQIALQLSGL